MCLILITTRLPMQLSSFGTILALSRNMSHQSNMMAEIKQTRSSQPGFPRIRESICKALIS